MDKSELVENKMEIKERKEFGPFMVNRFHAFAGFLTETLAEYGRLREDIAYKRTDVGSYRLCCLEKNLEFAVQQLRRFSVKVNQEAIRAQKENEEISKNLSTSQPSDYLRSQIIEDVYFQRRQEEHGKASTWIDCDGCAYCMNQLAI